METCCGAIRELECSVNDILQRITPIDYANNTLVINSSVSIDTSLFIDGVPINGGSGVLSLPENTMVGGTPLLSPHYVNGYYVLPNKTIINGYPILNTNYFSFYTGNTNVASEPFTSGCFINNCVSYTTGTGNILTFVTNYPFIVPRDCVLTSLLFSFVLQSGVSTITNAIATIYTISLNNVILNTGISATIPVCPVNSRNYASATFHYPIQDGYRIGVRVTFTGTSTALRTTFATLGYQFV